MKRFDWIIKEKIVLKKDEKKAQENFYEFGVINFFFINFYITKDKTTK